MDRNRLLLFITLSVMITFGFQYLLPGPPRHAVGTKIAATSSDAMQVGAGAPASPPAAPISGTAPDTRAAPRVTIDAPRVVGSISLVGARLDDLSLRDYHDTVRKNSPLVQLLAPADAPQPSSIQLGWAAADGIRVPDQATVWKNDGGDLTAEHPVSLTWDNGQGLLFRVEFSVDKNYMFSARQSVRNGTDKPLKIWPWQRVRRDYTPPPASYGTFEGMLGVLDRTTHQAAYAKIVGEAQKNNGVAFTHAAPGGWAGFTDKYWLTVLIPDQSAPVINQWYYAHDDGADHYQVSYQTADPQTVAPGATATFDNRLFVGAKEVHLLDRYQEQDHIPLLSYAVDWGWFYFLTQPFYYVIDWIYSLVGNFGVAIMIFTVMVKIAFYPLAAKSYQSMGKMRLLAPKIQAARDRHKDDPAKQQAAMMEVYKEEGISPLAQAGGCLPLLIQIPVFISLYSVILVMIEMRQAPFFGWIRDLSVVDPTNIFNLFGLLPFNPALISPYLHLGIWPVLLGITMYFQQMLNPPPPDPVQARMFKFMPIFLTFLMGRAPAGLVVYWTWNNLLTIGQQWYIQRSVKLDKVKV
jgi:YidC/Oxa1 family membrane protein insertase